MHSTTPTRSWKPEARRCPLRNKKSGVLALVSARCGVLYSMWPLDRTLRLRREWRKELRKQQRHMERDITKMQREMDKQKKEMKKVAAKDPTAARILAKSYVQMQRTHGKLYMAKVCAMVLQGYPTHVNPPSRPSSGPDVYRRESDCVANGPNENGWRHAEEHRGIPCATPVPSVPTLFS